MRQLSNNAGNPLPALALDALCTLIPYLMVTMGWAAPIHERWVRITTPSFLSSPCLALNESVAPEWLLGMMFGGNNDHSDPIRKS